MNLGGPDDPTFLKLLLNRSKPDWFRTIEREHNEHKLQLPPHFFEIDPKDLEHQTASLLRSLLWISGGDMLPRPNNLNFYPMDFTLQDFMILCGLASGVQTSSPKLFGSFECAELHKALSKSRSLRSPICTSTVLEMTASLRAHLPVSLPEDYVDLPPRLLSQFGVLLVRRMELDLSVTHF